MKRALALAGAVVVGVVLGRSVLRADGSSPAADAPVFFDGELSGSGGPVTGSRNIGIHLWRAPDATIAANRVCTTGPAPTIVTAGTFRVALSRECVEALRLLSRAWYEIVVDDVRFPLQEIGAVPFAVQPRWAPRNGARLQVRYGYIAGDDGTNMPYLASGKLFDTKLKEFCASLNLGAPLGTRCVPQSVGLETPPGLYKWWADAKCTVPLASSPLYWFGPPADTPAELPKAGSRAWMKTGASDAAGPVFRLMRITGSGNAYRGEGALFCEAWGGWATATESMETDFVALKTGEFE